MIACWCQREETPETPLSHVEKDQLQFLYDEWAHPYFISNLEFGRLMEVTSQFSHSITVGFTLRLRGVQELIQSHSRCVT